MNTAALPCRSHPAVSYRTVDRLTALVGTSCFSLPPNQKIQESAENRSAEVLDFGMTGRLSGGRLADTYSFGLFRLPSGQEVPACTTFDTKGFLLMEVATAWLSPSDLSAIARAFVAGHVREQARQSRRGKGRN